MKQDNKVFTRGFLLNWVLTIVLIGVIWVLVGKYFALSILLGSMTSMMMMSMMMKQNSRILEEGGSNASRRYFRGYVFRYIFYAFILVLAVYIENFDVLGVAIGLLLFRVSLYISIFIEKRGVQQ